MAHANVVVDDASSTGFEWAVGFGAKVIGETFARVPSLEFLRELRTPVYRVQLFRRRVRPVRGRQLPREVTEACHRRSRAGWSRLWTSAAARSAAARPRTPGPRGSSRS